MIQSLITLNAVLILYFVDKMLAKSVLLGASIAIIVTIYTMNKIFCQYDATKPNQMIQRFYVAQVGRMLIVMALFAIIFSQLMPINMSGLLISYFIMHLLPLFLTHNLR